MHKIFTAANGYYVADEGPDGFHHQPDDKGAYIGRDRAAAKRTLALAQQPTDEYGDTHRRAYIDDPSERG